MNIRGSESSYAKFHKGLKATFLPISEAFSIYCLMSILDYDIVSHIILQHSVQSLNKKNNYSRSGYHEMLEPRAIFKLRALTVATKQQKVTSALSKQKFCQHKHCILHKIVLEHLLIRCIEFLSKFLIK